MTKKGVPLSEQTIDVSKLTAQGIQLRNLPNSQWREWTQESRRRPEDHRLRKFLLEGLWDIEQFKEVLELLPPLQEGPSPESLESGLRWRTQTLFRLAFKGTSFVKRLIPVAISYSSYLGETESAAILQLLNDLVQSRDDKVLFQYHQLVLSVSKGVRQALQNLQIPFSPRLLLSPELAAGLGTEPREEIFNILKECSSPFMNYYAVGGNLLLLAEGGFFSEVPGQERKLISEEVSFQLDVIGGFRTLRTLARVLRPHLKYITATTSAQTHLANKIHRFFEELKTENGKPHGKEALKAMADVYEYLTELIEFISKIRGVLTPALALAYLESHISYYETGKVKLNIPMLEALLVMAEKLDEPPIGPQYLPKLVTIKCKIEELFAKLCLQKLDLKNLSRVLSSKRKNEFKAICLEYVDQFLRDCLGKSPDSKFLERAEFCLQISVIFKPQKERQKTLKVIVKTLRTMNDSK